VNTLLFVTRLNDRFDSTTGMNATQPNAVVFTPVFGPYDGHEITGIDSNLGLQDNYTGEVNVYSGELQQILEGTSHTTILGARLQYGHFNNSNFEVNADNYVSFFPPYGTPDAEQFYTTLFRRITVYGYHDWEIVDSLHLTSIRKTLEMFQSRVRNRLSIKFPPRPV
jgi:hypothetical protein